MVGIAKALPLSALWCISTAAQALDPAMPPVGTVQYRVDSSVFIRMRDGTRLATDLYLPEGRPGDRYPVVLIRTPYGNFPGSYLEPTERFFASHGYAVAVQDKRGKFRSEGIYTVSGGDANDGYDTIDWLSKQAWSNGKVGTYGCSYLGDVQIFVAQTKHPALKAMIPQASGSSTGSLGGTYRFFGARVGGAVDWAAAVGWFADYGQKVVPKLPADLPHADYVAAYAAWNRPPSPATVDYRRAWYHLPMVDSLADQGFPPSDFADTIAKSPADPYWTQFPYMTDAYTSDVPALFVNSWYDFGADITLREFDHFRKHSVSDSARNNQFAIMSPHVHCSSERDMRADAVIGERALGDTRFDYWTTYLTWFDYWLKGDESAGQRIRAWPKLRYYLMGANAWKNADDWPLTGTQHTVWFLASQGRANSLLGDGALRARTDASDGAPADMFVYDPANPVPSLGGAMCCTGTSDAVPGARDQRPVEMRQDVLVYTSAPLDAGIEVTGTAELVLYVGSSAVDTDFTGKLVDVYPDGRAFNVLESILRARYREGLDREVWLKPGDVYELRLPLGATSNFFAAGHRIRVEISSSNFPRFDRNLNVGGNNATQTHMATATNKIYHNQRYPSRLSLATVSRQAALP
jgi:uncharacterized protein